MARNSAPLFFLLVSVLVVAGCAATSGTSADDRQRTYNLPFEVVQEATMEAVRKSGFQVEQASFDGPHVFTVTATTARAYRQIETAGSRSRAHQSGVLVTIERLDAARTQVRLTNRARRVNYGSTNGSRHLRQLLNELDELVGGQ